MKWGVDASWPPTVEECITLQHSGFVFVMGYLGGTTPRPWTREEFLRCAEHELEVTPIWVAPLSEDAGRQQGVDEGNAALQTMIDAHMSGIVALDVENGLFPTDYVQGFADAVRAGRCSVMLYGTNSTLEVLCDLVDYTWLALWGQPHMETLPFPPDMWQYLSSSRYDFNIADSALPFAGLDIEAAQP